MAKLLWFISLIWFDSFNLSNETNQTNEKDQKLVTFSFSGRLFRATRFLICERSGPLSLTPQTRSSSLPFVN
jgi:hypothetical protein